MKIKIVKSRKRKKTFSIQVKNATVIVRAPFHASEQNINQVLTKHKKWIDKTIKSEKAEIIKKYHEGEKFLYLGKEFTLKLIENSDIKKGAFLNENYFVINTLNKNVTDDFIKREIEKFYKTNLKNVLIEKVDVYSKLINEEYKNIRVKRVSTIWGSCSSKKNLNFNLKLVLAPEKIVNYVVIHEVCHLKHQNHSKDFWNLVESIDPNYKDNRKWLRQNSWRLVY